MRVHIAPPDNAANSTETKTMAPTPGREDGAITGCAVFYQYTNMRVPVWVPEVLFTTLIDVALATSMETCPLKSQ